MKVSNLLLNPCNPRESVAEKSSGGDLKKIMVLVLFVFIIQSAGAQILQQEKLNLFRKKPEYGKLLSKPEETAEVSPLALILISWPINPMLVVEDKKPYFALTKEISVMFPSLINISKKPLILSLGGEYSYVARNGRNSHIRGYLDFIYVLEAGDFAAFLLGAGGGYFTDTRKSGLFPQLSFSFVFPVDHGIGFQGYIRARNTYMFKKEDSNIFDLSMGLGLSFFLHW